MMEKHIFIAGNPRKNEIDVYLKRLIDWADRNQVRLTLDEPLSEFIKDDKQITFKAINDVPDHIDLMLTLGGDGTILYNARKIIEKEIPILGLNLGGLGFLADINVDELIAAMEFVFHNEYTIENRDILRIEVDHTKKSAYAINDIVFDKSGYHRVIEIQVYYEKSFINGYIADGLIVSTPTGSTGYNLSSAGPIVIPESGVNIINPICPHSLTARPLIVPANKKLTVHVNTEFKHFKCHADGQELGKFKSGTSFTISQAPYKLKLVKLPDRDFFKTIRDKLRWGFDFRNKNRWTYSS